MTSRILAISAGCSDKGPIPIQIREPLMLRPMTGSSGSRSIPRPTAMAVKVNRRSWRWSRNATMTPAAMRTDNALHISCLGSRSLLPVRP